MSREETHKLLAEVGGGGEVGAREYEARAKAEAKVQEEIYAAYGGLLLEGDAIHQLYMELIKNVAARLSTIQTTPVLYQFFHWHVLSASRFYVAYDLFKRGYYFECLALARTIWETALTMAALKRGVIKIDELYSGPIESGKSPSDRERFLRMRQVDSRMKKTLIWENQNLSQAAISAVTTFENLVNSATHKSNLGVAINMGAVESGKPIHLHPVFDAKLTEMAGNILFLATGA